MLPETKTAWLVRWRGEEIGGCNFGGYETRDDHDMASIVARRRDEGYDVEVYEVKTTYTRIEVVT